MGKDITSMPEVIGHIVFLAELMMEVVKKTSHFSLISVERGTCAELSGNWQCGYFSNFLITTWTETLHFIWERWRNQCVHLETFIAADYCRVIWRGSAHGLYKSQMLVGVVEFFCLVWSWWKCRRTIQSWHNSPQIRKLTCFVSFGGFLLQRFPLFICINYQHCIKNFPSLQ